MHGLTYLKKKTFMLVYFLWSFGWEIGSFQYGEFCMLMNSTAYTLRDGHDLLLLYYFAARLTSEYVIYVGGFVFSHPLIVAHLFFLYWNCFMF